MVAIFEFLSSARARFFIANQFLQRYIRAYLNP